MNALKVQWKYFTLLPHVKLRLLSSVQKIPSFKTVPEVLQYVKTNKNSLTGSEVYGLFNTLFSLQHSTELEKIPGVKVFITDDKLKKFVDALTPRELVKVAKRYSQLLVPPGPEWDYLLNQISKHVKELSADELFDFLRFALEVVEVKPEYEVWKTVLLEMSEKAEEYNPNELSFVIKLASFLEFGEEQFWNNIDDQVLKKIDETGPVEATSILICYKEMTGGNPEIIKKLEKVIFNNIN